MTSRAERKRKKRSITLPGGQEIAARKQPGRRTDIESTRSAPEAALTARTRRFGYPDTPEGRKAVSAPEFGCPVGAAIATRAPTDRADLWDAVKHMRKVWLAYDRAIGAPARHAKCLGILAPTEAMTADASTPALDLRPQEDRDRAAVSEFMRLQGWLDHVDRAARSATIRAVVDEPEEPVHNWDGIRRTLLCVVDGIKGRRITARFNTTP